MRPSKRQFSIPILVLCLLLAVFWAATGYLAIRHGACDCPTETCPVCLLLSANRLLRQGFFGLCLLVVLSGLALSRAVLRTAITAVFYLSPVSAKVKLSC